jgi:transposase
LNRFCPTSLPNPTAAGPASTTALGLHRWVVERTLSWMSKYRRLTIRYERRDDVHDAFLHLGCSLICLNYLS